MSSVRHHNRHDKSKQVLAEPPATRSGLSETATISKAKHLGGSSRTLPGTPMVTVCRCSSSMHPNGHRVSMLFLAPQWSPCVDARQAAALLSIMMGPLPLFRLVSAPASR